MLESCTNLLDCEKILLSRLDGIRFIGQIELSVQDLDIITQFIKECIKGDSSIGLRYLEQYAPCCTAFFLVNQGIWGYKEGNFWSYISDLLGAHDPFLQTRLGSLFLSFIKKYNLAQFDTGATYRYVAPILVHGGIPQECLGEFFSNIVTDLYDQGFSHDYEVKDYLYSMRSKDTQRKDEERKITALGEKNERFQREIEQIEKLMDLQKKAADWRMIVQKDEKGPCSTEILKEYQCTRAELDDIQQKIEQLLQEQGECEQKIKSLSQEEMRIVENAETIENLKHEYKNILNQQERLNYLIMEEERYNRNFTQCSMEHWGEPWKEGYRESFENFDINAAASKHQEYMDHNHIYSEKKKQAENYKWVDVKINWTLWLGLFFIFVGIVFFRLYGNSLAYASSIVGGGFFIHALLTFARGKRERKRQELHYNQLIQDMKVEESKLEELRCELVRMLGKLPCKEWFWKESTQSLIDRFTVIHEAYKVYVKYQGLRMQQVMNIEQTRTRLEQVAADSMGNMEGSLEKRIDKALGILKDIRIKKNAADEASELIEERIKPALKINMGKKEDIQKRLSAIESQLSSLGQGSVKEGLAEVKRRISARFQLEYANRKLKNMLKILSLNDAELDPREVIQNRYTYIRKQLRELQDEIRARETNLRNSFPSTPNVQEPIRRFLLYGETWVEEWLIESLKLFDQRILGRKAQVGAGYKLPARVHEAFEEWWDELGNPAKDEPSDFDPKRQRFSTPVLAIDPVLGAVKLKVGQQRLEVKDIHIDYKLSYVIELYESQSSPIMITPRTYLNRAGLVETESIEINLKELSSSYKVTLSDQKRILHQWIIDGIHLEHPYLIFTEDGMRVQSEGFPNQRLWFFMPRNWAFAPEVQVIESVLVPAFGDIYNLLLVDLSDVDSITICHKDTGKKLISLQSIRERQPYITGVQPFPGVHVNGNPIYTEELPKLVVPIDEQSSLKRWSITIWKGYKHGENGKSLRLEELKDVCISPLTGEVEIPLGVPQLLGRTPLGCYTISVRDGRWKEYTYYVVIIPDLVVDFEPFLYFPSDAQIKEIQATLILPENVLFTVKSNAEMKSVVDEAYEISIPNSEDWLRGELELCFAEAEARSLPIEIEIPKVKWRILGLEGYDFAHWAYHSDEIWFGDWERSNMLILQLELPQNLGYYVELRMDNSDQYASAVLKGGKAQFNLLAFTDTMKTNKNSHVFWLSLFNDRYKVISRGALFAVRCQWEVMNMRHAIYSTERGKMLHIEWKEKGKAADRVIRLWNMQKPWDAPVVEHIANGENMVEIDMDYIRISPGKYLAQFDVEDPWMGYLNEVHFPKDMFNVSVIDIKTDQPHIRNWKIEWRSSKNAFICGNVDPLYAGEKVSVMLAGIIKGEVRVKEESTYINGNGNFSISIRNEGGPELQRIAHWLVIGIWAETPVYQVSLIDEPAPLECKLSDDICGYLLNSTFDIGIRLITDKGHSFGKMLTSKDSRTLLKKLYQGENDILLNQGTGTNTQHIKLTWEQKKCYGKIVMQNGVKCTSCGAILKNQEEWDRFHYPRCKRLIPHYSESRPVMILVRWDYTPVLKYFRAKYPLADEYPYILFSSWNEALPDIVDLNALFHNSFEKIIPFLLEKEKERAQLMLKGEGKGEY